MASYTLPKELPFTLKELGTKLQSYGFTISREYGHWRVAFPATNDISAHEIAEYGMNWGGVSGMSLTGDERSVGFDDRTLAGGLLKLARYYEEKRNLLHRYEQFDRKWKDIVYGKARNDTTIGQAGCGPTSLAIVLQYLMNNGSRPRDACYMVAPPETAKYAATHGRVSGHGTAGDPMIKGIREQWKGFDGVKVNLNEAVGLLEEGKLIIFLCKGCKGLTGNGKEVSYAGHYMVLAGIEAGEGSKRRFYVVDPGRSEAKAMKSITYADLKLHATGFWWVYAVTEPEARKSAS